ncbi:DUF6241 domain-containing protein [Bacillus sp. C1]
MLDILERWEKGDFSQAVGEHNYIWEREGGENVGEIGGEAIRLATQKEEKHMPEGIQLRQVQYLNNIVEQDHRFIKRRVRSMLGLKSFKTAISILSGVEAMHMLKKGQLHRQVKSAQNEVRFIHKLFGIAS